ncbi:unnamed protein product, partial [Nesidiocoris tenuis]
WPYNVADGCIIILAVPPYKPEHLSRLSSAKTTSLILSVVLPVQPLFGSRLPVFLSSYPNLSQWLPGSLNSSSIRACFKLAERVFRFFLPKQLQKKSKVYKFIKYESFKYAPLVFPLVRERNAQSPGNPQKPIIRSLNYEKGHPWISVQVFGKLETFEHWKTRYSESNVDFSSKNPRPLAQLSELRMRCSPVSSRHRAQDDSPTTFTLRGTKRRRTYDSRPRNSL